MNQWDVYNDKIGKMGKNKIKTFKNYKKIYSYLAHCSNDYAQDFKMKERQQVENFIKTVLPSIQC